MVVGGRPGSGKSTVAASLARRRRIPFLRVDRIEQAVVDHTSLSHPVGPVGENRAEGVGRTYEPWPEPHLVLDSAACTVETLVDAVDARSTACVVGDRAGKTEEVRLTPARGFR